MTAGLGEVRKQLRKEVSAQPLDTPHESSLKAGMRKLVGSRFKKGGMSKVGKRHVMVAKVGFGVGKKSDARMSKGTTSGVGVTRTTAHWYVLGTSEMGALFEGAVDRAASTAGPMAMSAAVKKAKQRFEKLAAKQAKRRR